MNERFETYNPVETEAFGEKLGREAKAGQVYCLSGDLGVGKTVFTKGFAKGLEVTEYVTSPTFAIVNEYEGRLPLYHYDVYRISCEEEMEDTGYEDYFYGEGVCLVEWA
ncbi:MAG: tRNA (adenosine(37)-N6)-threonylcarbamoyltransferase complex ATPase subunit type 1 TsaE, partial [Anaerotignum sp.]|nr:tRNA (adenosine(37)-N6)-threonylcarbamoyltransferase complex ATPase subunit type 1 TsaE [Anaerotignum sp.]